MARPALVLITVLTAGAAEAQDLARRAIAALRVVDLDGRVWTGAQLDERVTLIDFWATWCAPCLAELPYLKEARRRYSRDEFEVLGVSFDVGERRTLASWLNRHGVVWPQVFDGRGRRGPLARQFGVSAVPTSFLVESGGRIAGMNLRGQQLLDAVGAAVMRLRASRSLPRAASTRREPRS